MISRCPVSYSFYAVYVYAEIMYLAQFTFKTTGQIEMFSFVFPEIRLNNPPAVSIK